LRAIIFVREAFNYQAQLVEAAGEKERGALAVTSRIIKKQIADTERVFICIAREFVNVQGANSNRPSALKSTIGVSLSTCLAVAA